MNQLVTALRYGDRDSFVQLKYQRLQEGDVLRFDNLDLRGVDLSTVPLSFTYFVACNLSSASFRSNYLLPTAFQHCDMQRVDLRGTGGVVDMYACDLRDAVWDEQTSLGPMKLDSEPSRLEAVQMDQRLHHFLANQGVRFKLRKPLDAIYDMAQNCAYQ
ncbi:pentapeptide repeat-containing protein [Fodinicola acaciae]|uniref:pentapeptide repeat-containing protein n=1 Tax=Fodinicola acaciae TaxID=2681555 RepID=UPI0013D6F299|nr:hypothetical protein [Fodinicola acaciae]